MGILDGIKGRDSVLGAIAAGAAGINPLVGLLAGPLLANSPSRQRKEMENQQMRDQMAARQELPGVLAAASMPHPMSARPGTQDVPLPPQMHAQHAAESQAPTRRISRD